MVQQRSRPTSATATGTVASHVTALDGLRGLAIAGVLLFHTGNLPGGFLGVDLFFVLSGFLITGVLLREITTRGGVSLKRFWGRRLRRLFPALAALLLVTSVVTWWLQRSDAVMSVTHELVRTTLSDGLWVQMNLANWHLLAQDASYWEAFGQPRLFGHLWSIAVEEQFYVVWPSLLMVLVAVISRVKGRRRSLDANTLGWTVIALCAVLAAVSQLLMVLLLDGGDPTRVYTGTDTRAFSLLLGAAAATEPARRLFDAVFHALGKAAGALMTLLAAVMLGSWAVVDGTDFPGLFTGGLFAHAAVAALLIGLCAAQQRAGVNGGLAQRVLRFPVLVWLGRVSYSLYLWHWPVAVLLEPLLGGWASTALVVAVSLALAAASTYLIEDPVRFRARWARGRSGFIAFVVVSAVLICVWVLLPSPGAQQVEVGLL